jgi:hypothetical protein
MKPTEPVWETIIEAGDRHHATIIVVGSGRLTGLRSMPLGSVSVLSCIAPVDLRWSSMTTARTRAARSAMTAAVTAGSAQAATGFSGTAGAVGAHVS